MKRQFSKDTMLDILDSKFVISDEIVEHTRWSVVHEIIFKYEDKFWQTYYSVGATESQEESPWEYDKEVGCFEVKPVEKMVVVYEKIPD